LKAGEKRQVPVSVQVQKNHSGNAYFRIFITPSKGKKEFVSLNICQFDTKAEVMTTKPPAMFKTLSEALKNKTKLGRLIRKPDKTFLIYGNIHLFCFDTKSGKFSWHYNNKTSIIDLWINGGYIFTQNLEKIAISNGKLCLHKGYGAKLPEGDFICESYNILLDGMTNIGLIYPDGNVCWPHHQCFKTNLGSAISWLVEGRNGLFGILPGRPDVVWVENWGCEASPGRLSAYALLSGRQLCNSGPYYSMSYKRDHNVIIFEYPNGGLSVIDTLSLKKIFQIEHLGSDLHVSDTGSAIIYADCKQCGAYDYSKRKLLWRHYGDGEPLCDPVFDKAGDSVYILDEDSTWNSDYKKKKDAQYLRLYKFDVGTGKQYWKAILFKIPKDHHSNGECIIELKGEKVVVSVVSYYMYDGYINEKSYTFTVRASDGKPWK
jgi:outer membrane protein assembly factor BamB